MSACNPQTPAPRPGSYSRASSEEKPKRPAAWRRFLRKLAEDFSDDLIVLIAATVGGIVRMSGVQVNTGHAGLLFHFGRARQVLGHGFRPLIPYFQQVTIVPIRSRTMDLPSQRVVNSDGLVYYADANLVYRIEDITKAIVEIDQLEKGMMQMLTLGVQEILRATTRETVRHTDQLAHALQADLSKRLSPWGVVVEKAGFPTLSPSPQTLRITQLEQRIEERLERYKDFREHGLGSPLALAMVGTRTFPHSRTSAFKRQALAQSAQRRTLARLALQAKNKKRKRPRFIWWAEPATKSNPNGAAKPAGSASTRARSNA